MSSVIASEFTHFRHIKTRKVVVLECEIPEEAFQNAISVLGMPIGGESKPVAIALLQKEVITQSSYNPINSSNAIKRNHVVKAVMLCKNPMFQNYTAIKVDKPACEETACLYIKSFCGIESRSELNADKIAQNNLEKLISEFDTWKLEQSYKDNIGRM